MMRNLPKKYGITGLTIGILIAVSRVYLGVHYPSDVIAGAIVGTFSAFTSEKAVNFAEKKLKKQ